jgi:hypothetical protein
VLGNVTDTLLVIADGALALAVGFAIGVLYMLVRIVTGDGGLRDRYRDRREDD